MPNLTFVTPANLPAELAPFAASPKSPWNLHKIAHLYRRAGLGATMDEFATSEEQGFAKTLDRVLSMDRSPSELDLFLNTVTTELVQFGDEIGQAQSLWLYRMLVTRRPLEEKMALFWHGHFATANYKVNSPQLMYQQYETLRKHGMGRFEDLLLAVARDPAMLIWLDNVTNRKGHANENFAREIMELFTMGPGHYTETDIQEAARAFTGWHLGGGGFYFNRNQHDNGPKTFLGHQGPLAGEDVVRILAARPETARFLADKLLRYFVMNKPSDAVIQGLADVYLANDGNISAVMNVLLRSKLFFSDTAYWSLIKSPVELVVGTLRLLDANSNRRMTFPYLRKMGQELFNPPNVKGWDGGEAWINTVTMLERMNFLNDIMLRSPVKVPGRDHLLLQELKNRDLKAGEDVVNFFANYLVQQNLSAAQRQVLTDYYKAEVAKVDAGGESWDYKLRRLAYMFMTLSSYQLN